MAPNETSEFHLQPDRSAGSTAELELRSFNDLPEQAALLGGLRARRTFANSADGTEIPLTIIDSGAPLKAAILRVYGAYGSEVFPAYDPVWLPLIRRGVAEAICHTRGGGYFGPKWHQAGIRGSKQRGTEDLIACAKALKHSGVSNVIPYAKSAGAVLAANALSQHPELFAGAVLDAPLLAIEATLTDSTVPHGARERLEWGDATEIALVDPVRQVRAVAYPPILVTARSGDPLVRFRDALWWLQLVRERTTGEAWNGVYISGGSSHLGEDHQFQDRDIAAMRWSFVIAVVEGRV